METLLLHERLKLSGDMRVRISGLGPLVDGLQTQVEGGSLLFHSGIPSDALARLLSRILDAPHAPGSQKGGDLVRGVPAPAPGSSAAQGSSAPKAAAH